jgi:hypothetical protein
MEVIEQNKRMPSVNNSFGNGWEVMKKNFLILLLVVIVVSIVTGPAGSFKWNMNQHHPWNWDSSGWHMPDQDMVWVLALGMMGMILGLLALAWSLLIVPVFRYGGKMMFLQAVREIRPDFNILVSGFRQNYLGIVLANLLTGALIMLGFIMLVIPGIIVSCRLAFVGFLVMDKKLDPITAVEESWRMTRGYGWTILGMALLSFFIFIAGLCLLIVGVFPAGVWVGSSFATLYNDVLASKEVQVAAV